MMRSVSRTARVLILALVVSACSENPFDAVAGPSLGGVSYSLGGGAYAIDADGVLSVPLFAGQHTHVGWLRVAPDAGNTLKVTYEMLGACLRETHLHVAASAAALPQNRAGNPQIGRFQYGERFRDCASTWTQSAIPRPNGTAYIAAHAVVHTYTSSVLFGLYDAPPGEPAGDGAIYAVDLAAGTARLVGANVGLGVADQYSPNGLAYDPNMHRLVFASTAGTGAELVSVLYSWDLASGRRTELGVIEEERRIYSGAIHGDRYYYVPNDFPWLMAVDIGGPGIGGPVPVCDIGRPMRFGDIAIQGGTVYGSARGAEPPQEFLFFTVDLMSCATTVLVKAEQGFMMQIAFGSDGVLYGHQALSAGAGSPGRWYRVDTATGEPTHIGFTDPPVSFTDVSAGPAGRSREETAWADGVPFSVRGSWAMYLTYPPDG